jgi:hypothetical protein
MTNDADPDPAFNFAEIRVKYLGSGSSIFGQCADPDPGF